jgi:hypothetical protein
LLRARTAATDDVVTMAFATATGEVMSNSLGRTAVLSPDGRTVVYSSTDSAGRLNLYARRLDDLQHYTLPGTENARIRSSVDGLCIAFLAAC